MNAFAQIQFPNDVIINDPARLLEYYCNDMTFGIRYAEWVFSDKNLQNPNRLLNQNWTAAFWVRARGMRRRDLELFLSDSEDDLVPLSSIPVDVDLCSDWELCRHDVRSALEILLAVRGVAWANATKLLHQKRPRLIPILDSYVCEHLDIEYDRSAEGALRAMDAVRRAMMAYGNDVALQQLKAWIKSAVQLPLSDELRERMSFVRLFDVMLWGITASAYYEGPTFQSQFTSAQRGEQRSAH